MEKLTRLHPPEEVPNLQPAPDGEGGDLALDEPWASGQRKRYLASLHHPDQLH
jgi:hypothetical protein